MQNLVIILIIGMLVALAAGYVYRAKKRGAKCIGCPDAKRCSGNCGNCPGCGCVKK